MLESDPNRRHWEAIARDEDADWAVLATEPIGVDEVIVEHPAGSWLHPRGGLAGPAVLAIHGGGFVSGSARTHRRMFGHLTLAAGVPVFVTEYDLVPEYVFPSQVETVTNVYRWLLDQGATSVAVVGDSCGAGLALAVALRARDSGTVPPACLVLFSAWVDLEATGGTYDTGSDPFFTREIVQGLGAGYLAGADPHDPLAAALHADLRDLPPAYLQVGAEESLLDDSRRLARRLRDAGVDVGLDEFAGQLHTFQMAAGRMAVADEAIERAGAWLRSRVTA
ncbi:MAG: alpha/beta hydrolase [Nocardioides sp.]